MRDFVFDVRVVGDGCADFLTQYFSVSTAKAVDGDLDGTLGGSEGPRRVGITAIALVPFHVPFEALEQGVLAGSDALVAEGRRGSLEDAKRPLALEYPFRRQGVERMGQIDTLGGLDFDWDEHHAAAAFLRPLAIPVVGEKVGE